MTDDRYRAQEESEGFDAWLRAEALAPPKAPAAEWPAIQRQLEAQRQPASLWSLTWPSLIAAAIPLALALWGGSAGVISPLLPTAGTVVTSPAPHSAQSPAGSLGAEADDDQLWLSAGSGQLDVMAAADAEPLFLD